MSTRKIGLVNYLAYGSGDFLGAGTTALTAAWLLYFYTTFCGLTPIEAAFIFAMARVLDVPARYVTGYLFAGPADAAHPDEVRVGAQASHAWAEIHVDGLGWVGFDAANNCCPDDRYVRLCSGFDAIDAAPIRGLAMGRGDEDLEVAVAVEAVQQ